ncbi:MAG: metallophosphoesterase [Myxococcota bacterium]
MRLAHFSDVHVTLSPFTEGWRGLGLKRLLGGLNYYFGRRGQRFSGSGQRLERLLETIDSLGVDHALCTGDLTSMSFRAEFEAAAAIFGPRAQDPARFTVLPGNHDRYVQEAIAGRWFEAQFSAVAAPQYPFEKPLAAGVTLVLVDVTRATRPFDSSGWCGPQQLQALREILERRREGFLAVALHYGLLRKDGARDRRTHGIRDDRELLALLDDPNLHVDLVLHGHMHGAYRVGTERRSIGCAGSATDLAHGCGFDVYDIDPGTRRFSVQRYAYARDRDRYVAVP